MIENIKRFFKKFSKGNENTSNSSKNSSKDAAKERLHLVLMQDRANVSADFLELMKQEIIEVIKKYIDVDEEAIDVRLTNKENDDGTNGAPALYANIPIVNIKNETRKVENKEENKNKQEEEKTEEPKDDKKEEENKEGKKEDKEESSEEDVVDDGQEDSKEENEDTEEKLKSEE